MKTVADFTKKELVTVKADLRAAALVEIEKYAKQIEKLRRELIFATAHHDYAQRIYAAANAEYNAAREAAQKAEQELARKALKGGAR